MTHESTLRLVLAALGFVLFPTLAYYWIRSQRTREPLDRRKEGLFLLITMRPAGFVALAGLAVYLIDPSRMAWSSVPLSVQVRWAGAGFATAGGALLIWTFRTLGPNLTDTVVTRKAHVLVTRGPYRWVRHPFYLATAMLAAGASLAAANWFLLLSSAVFYALLMMRTRIEEALLIARFGDAYRNYAKRTGRLLPRFGRIPSGDRDAR